MYREKIHLQNYKLLDTIFFQKPTRSDENKLKCTTGFEYYLLNQKNTSFLKILIFEQLYHATYFE
ncbi:hypothetical protein M2373_000188 [Chryseobacterium sp. JUb7]|nr:hypothetical protein [Chryseobacterium sp. JUb7]